MSEAVDRALSENHALIAAILDHRAAGRHTAVVSLLERLQTNLEFIAAVADHGLPVQPTPLPQQFLQQQHLQTQHPTILPHPQPHQFHPHHIPQSISQPLRHPQQQSSLPLPSVQSMPLIGPSESLPPTAPRSIPAPSFNVPVTTTTHIASIPQQIHMPPASLIAPTSTATPVGLPTHSVLSPALMAPLRPQPPVTLPSVQPIAPAPLPSVSSPQLSAGSASMFWSPEEHARFEEAMALYGTMGKQGRPNFKAIASHVGTRTPTQVRNHLLKVRPIAAGPSGTESASNFDDIPTPSQSVHATTTQASSSSHVAVTHPPPSPGVHGSITSPATTALNAPTSGCALAPSSAPPPPS